LSASLIPKSVHAGGTPQHDVSGDHSTNSESHVQPKQSGSGFGMVDAARLFAHVQDQKNKLEKAQRDKKR
jgi:hypothetical protein